MNMESILGQSGENEETPSNSGDSKEKVEAGDNHANRTIDGSCPLIVFIGPAGCGKSMVLMSLVEYITRNSLDLNLTCDANSSYIKGNEYKNNCKEFMRNLTKNATTGSDEQKEALPGTLKEILIDVSEEAERKYYMLEAPGEDFFSNSNNEMEMKGYLKTFFDKDRTSKYPVYFVMLLDLYTRDSEMKSDGTLRKHYEDRLLDIYDKGFNSRRGDKLILLYNKFDQSDTKTADNVKLLELLNTYYPNIKNKFVRKLLWFKFPNYKLLPFVSGVQFEQSPDENGNNHILYRTNDKVKLYAKSLWNELSKTKWE